MGLTPEQRLLRAKMGGLAARAAGHTTTEAARAAFDSRFYAGIPEDLPAAERDHRAAAARRLYFARLALKSSQTRSRKARTGPVCARFLRPISGGSPFLEVGDKYQHSDPCASRAERDAELRALAEDAEGLP